MNVLFIMKKWYTIIHDGGFFMKSELIDDMLDPNFNFDEDYYEDANTDVETTCLNVDTLFQILSMENVLERNTI